MRRLRVLWALARFYGQAVPRRWYLRPPFLPLPPRRYLTWRLQTAYGTRRPPWRLLWQDLWQFGGWLADFGEPE